MDEKHPDNINNLCYLVVDIINKHHLPKWREEWNKKIESIAQDFVKMVMQGLPEKILKSDDLIKPVNGYCQTQLTRIEKELHDRYNTWIASVAISEIHAMNNSYKEKFERDLDRIKNSFDVCMRKYIHGLIEQQKKEQDVRDRSCSYQEKKLLELKKELMKEISDKFESFQNRKNKGLFSFFSRGSGGPKRADNSNNVVTSPSIDTLNLYPRVANILKNNGIKYINELTNKTPEDLLKIKWLGRKGKNLIEEALYSKGFTLKN